MNRAGDRVRLANNYLKFLFWQELMKIAMFPNGAINHPSLFMSASILFEKVTVLRPQDIFSCVDQLVWTDTWYYIERYHDRNAEAFWTKNTPLLSEGVLTCFESKNDTSSMPFGKKFASPRIPIIFEDDRVGEVSAPPFERRVWYSIGFSEFFQYLANSKIPTVCSDTERASNKYLRTANNIDDISPLTDIAARVLSCCIPELSTDVLSSVSLAERILKIRQATEEERLHYLAFIGSLSYGLTSLLTPEERASIIETIIKDCVEQWEAYTSKLVEFCRRMTIPLRFISILQNIVKLDAVGLMKDFLEGKNNELGTVRRQEERAFGFIKQVQKVNDYWLKP